MQNLIFRKQYLDKIMPFMGKKLIKVITGQRRVGKSYLLFQLIEKIKQSDSTAHIIYINKEDLQFSHIKTAQDLADFVLANKKAGVKNHIFIDEIQEITNFEQALRSLLLDDDLDLYCTGSNAQLLSTDIAGTLSGRAIEIQVYALSYFEFLEFMQLDNNPKSLNLYFKYGGLPFLKELPLQDDVIFEYLKNIYSTIVVRDIVNRYNIRNGLFLEQLTQFLADNIGNLFSAKKISDFLKSQKINISNIQVQNYAEYLSNAFLIHKVNRYDIEGKRIFEIGEKYYFEDLGIRNALIGYRISDRAKILENMVFHHLKIAGFDIKIGGLNNQEIDFVADKNGERIYVQVALMIDSDKTAEREFGNLLKIADNYPKYVVTLDEFDGNSINGIKCLNFIEFITEILGETP
ncbi:MULTISPECIES: ATP-binding protein [Moraxella]|uniref:ATPase n=1 Tax=Moraxella lacunata TaxID=477 RepID=A0A1B8Q339_MORLA|nr:MULTISPECIES: ATP-binding protein [Moraxella]MBE9579648.1 ATP-binding protein [Moraxella sp. K1664]MBE9588981.1 ATP-binding protein [Moraxella sp. K1630]MBE9591569.1 ATP-binding protein [Moraxella sp. K127]MBE9597240.1 ATP-binding protein [Moraxella sp. K2450]MDH9219741.1 ATP-binding protein [Moraxella lacunata]